MRFLYFGSLFLSDGDIEKRKNKYSGQRSPSPTNKIFNASSGMSSMTSNMSSPTLPLPSRTAKLPPETNAKLMFFTMLGLLKLGETDKKGKILTDTGCH